MSKLPATLGIAVLIMSSAACPADETDATLYAVLGEGAHALREDFNAAKGSIRLLFVVDPICPGCLRGLDDMNNALLAKTRDARLQTYVIHVPVLGPEAKDVAPAAKVLDNPDVHHYWNPSGSFGLELSGALGLKSEGESVYAWDVWLLYGPEASWDGVAPPQPLLLMHQLYALRDSEFAPFDSEKFAQEVRRLLAALDSTTLP